LQSQPQEAKAEEFPPLSDSVVLVCAVLASLASGVLVAYGVCLAMFGLFRMTAQQATTKAEAAVRRPASIVEG
jgi:predicted phage tail protein